MYFFVPKDFGLEKEYRKGFAVNELFIKNSVGIVTAKDSFVICDKEQTVEDRIIDLIGLSEEELRKKYRLKDSQNWSIAQAKKDVGDKFDESKIIPIDYRWGDIKYLYYTGLTNGLVARPRYNSLSAMLGRDNVALLTVRQIAGTEWRHISISQTVVDDCRVSNKTKERGYVFPLYISSNENNSLIPNFNTGIVNNIELCVGEKI